MDRFMAVAGLFMAVAVLGFAGAITYYTPASGGEHYDVDSAVSVAKQFVKTDATYRFDGMGDTLRVSLNRTLSAYGFEIVTEFTSAQAGYGDRSGQMLAQVLTYHRAIIVVEGGQVTSAVMDGVWDMMTQKMISGPATMPRQESNAGVPDSQTNTTGPAAQL